MAGAGDHLWGFGSVGPPPDPSRLMQAIALDTQREREMQQREQQMAEQAAFRNAQLESQAQMRQAQLQALASWHELQAQQRDRGLDLRDRAISEAADARDRALTAREAKVQEDSIRHAAALRMQGIQGAGQDIEKTANMPVLQSAMGVPLGPSPAYSDKPPAIQLGDLEAYSRQAAEQAAATGEVQRPPMETRVSRFAEPETGNPMFTPPGQSSVMLPASLGQRQFQNAPVQTQATQQTYQAPPSTPGDVAAMLESERGRIQAGAEQNLLAIQQQRDAERARLARERMAKQPDDAFKKTSLRLYSQLLPKALGEYTAMPPDAQKEFIGKVLDPTWDPQDVRQRNGAMYVRSAAKALKDAGREDSQVLADLQTFKPSPGTGTGATGQSNAVRLKNLQSGTPQIPGGSGEPETTPLLGSQPGSP